MTKSEAVKTMRAEGLITVEEASRKVGRATRTIWAWLAEGKLSRFKSVGRTFVDWEELKRLVEPRRVK